MIIIPKNYGCPLRVDTGLSFLKELNLFLTISLPFPVLVDGAGGAPEDFVFAHGAGDPAAEHEKGI